MKLTRVIIGQILGVCDFQGYATSVFSLRTFSKKMCQVSIQNKMQEDMTMLLGIPPGAIRQLRNMRETGQNRTAGRLPTRTLVLCSWQKAFTWQGKME